MLLITITIKTITNLIESNLQFHNAMSLVNVFQKLQDFIAFRLRTQLL